MCAYDELCEVVRVDVRLNLLAPEMEVLFIELLRDLQRKIEAT